MDTSSYHVAENQPFHRFSDKIKTESPGIVLSRVEEIIAFCRKAGYKKIGIALCIRFGEHGYQLSRILKRHAFKVESVCCKVGGLQKPDYGVDVAEGDSATICAPAGQAEILNRAGTDLNIQMGLCVGHDILFTKYSEAPVTVLGVKDRATDNNPLTVLVDPKWRTHFQMSARADRISRNRDESKENYLHMMISERSGG
ncbi:MAG: DUF1847 domain-containing protein [Magnetococcales bacterium]|nr:DUF1847 domain-containing protein [Magnetococcales bacterium]